MQLGAFHNPKEKKCKQTTTALAIIHSMIGIRGCHLDLEGIAHEAGQLATRARIHTIRMEIDGADVRAAEVVGWQRHGLKPTAAGGPGPDKRLALYPFLFPRYPHPERKTPQVSQSVLASQVDAV